ncbi:MAG: preprotein translocase subunit SecD [Pseudonocardiales bacterium]|nr:preprotein translocase subunit SecD [Pseudonocardiales bacterium]
MAPPVGTLRVGRYFLALLAILAVLYTIVFWPGQRHSPKLGIDLVGGTEVTFTAKTPEGKTPSKSSMNQAKQIMENRVNGSGVTQATVVVQGGNQIIIDIPKSSNTNVAALGKAAVLSMRGAVMPPQPVSCTSTSGSTGSAGTPSSSSSGTPTPSSGASPTASGSATATTNNASSRKLAAPAASTTPTVSTTPTTGTATTPASGTASASSTTAPPPPCEANPLKSLTFPIPTAETCAANATNCHAYSTLTATQQTQLQQAVSKIDCTLASNQPDTAPSYVACDDGKTYGAVVAYLLGPSIVTGQQIAGADAAAPNISGGQTQWTVQLQLKGSGQSAWANYTGAHNLGSTTASVPSALQCSASATPCADYVGFVLDGQVISAPANLSAINGQTTEISGSFTSSSAKQLASELKYGALPLSFTAEDAVNVSATLGSSQLKAGLLAGGLGLGLVIIYSLIYYRALGFVTIASLLVSGVLTYGSLVMLGTQIGFTLSLAGIAGFIVAVGITADSFVVFFERMKDEVHEGRSARVAVPRAWVRARRTILSADTVSFLAAAILYYFAAGDVKGFAFTLGLSTILDLVVVFLFTHPLVSLLSRSRAFGSARFTGLDAVRAAGGVTAPPPDEPAPRRRGAKRAASRAGGRTEPPRSGAPAPSAGGGAGGAGGVVVLDKPDDDGRADNVQAGAEPTAEPPWSPERPEPTEPTEPGAPAAASTADIGEGGSAADRAVDEVADEPRPVTPVPGTAAERAAARRARLRAERDKS